MDSSRIMSKYSTKTRVQKITPASVRTEAVQGALPVGANSPQKPPYGLYAEKLSGTAFTAPRHENMQTWLYRVLPSSAHSDFEPCDLVHGGTTPDSKKLRQIPNQLRWDPFDLNEDL